MKRTVCFAFFASISDVPTTAEVGRRVSPSRAGRVSWCRAERRGTSSRINAEVTGVLKQPETAERVREQGFDVVANSPEAAQRFMANEVDNWYGLVVPAGTSRSIVVRLHGEIVRIISIPTVREKLIAQGIEPVGSTPEDFGPFMKTEIAKWAGVIRSANIRLD